MIGIGKWTAHVTMKVYTGNIDFDIIDNNGEYDIKFHFPAKYEKLFSNLNYEDIKAEGNTLSGKGVLKLGMMKYEMLVSATFDGDKVTGVLDIPMLKKQFPLEDGHRIG